MCFAAAISASQDTPSDCRSGIVSDFLKREIRFIPSDEFAESPPEIPGREGESGTGRSEQRVPSDVPGHLRYLWDTPLLTPAEEADLFRRMNLLRYQAHVIQCRLQEDSELRGQLQSAEELTRYAEACLNAADAVRSRIVRANVRLVVSIARRFVSDHEDLDELISDGNAVLLNAVERFDYSRGFRFSTYATHAIRREYYRRYRRSRRRREVEVITEPGILRSVAADRTLDEHYEKEAELLAAVETLMQEHLDQRDREILRSRVGLDSDKPAQTLREIGEKLGISKERVRQLQARAVNSLRNLIRRSPAGDSAAG